MKHFLARLLGHDRELRLKDAAIKRQQDQIEASKRAADLTELVADLTELLEAQQEQATTAARLLRDARKVINLRNSGPAKAREHMNQAIHLLEGDKQ